MNEDIAHQYELLTPSQKAWFDKRVAGLDEPVQREWLLYVKVEEILNKDGVAVRFNHDMSGFYFTYAVKATDTWHTFFPFQAWEDDEGKGGVTYQCVEDAEEKAHEVFWVSMPRPWTAWPIGSRRRSNPRRPSPRQADPTRIRTNPMSTP